MNSFLHIDRKLILFLALILFIFFIIFIYARNISINNINFKSIEQNLSNVDISKPKFTINNETKKIYITAKEGNFIDKNKILLKDNVRFKSNDFSIETENVIFDRYKQTAISKTTSLFKSEKTIIKAEGFNINDKGNKIIFYGNSYIVLK